MDTRSFRVVKMNFFLFVLSVLPVAIYAQSQNIKVIAKSTIYRQQVLKDSNNQMVELRAAIPDLKYDLRYATAQNFTGRKLYKSGENTFLRQPVVAALSKVQALLAQEDLALKVFDAYRPYSVTKKMWDLIGDERYVANPANGSGHNRGTSVDVTLIQLSTGREIDMGTGFDHFTDTAHHGFSQLPPTVLSNRTRLRSIMELHGFTALDTEWWHYSWKGASRFDLLDLTFQQLKKFSSKARKK